MIVAEQIIARFGGIRPMATKLGVPVTTVQGWKERGIIPKKREGEIRAAAAAHGIALADTDLRRAGGDPRLAGGDPRLAGAFGGTGGPAETIDGEFDGAESGQADFSEADSAGTGGADGEPAAAFEAWRQAETSSPAPEGERTDARAEFHQSAPRVTIVPGSRPKRLYAALIGIGLGFVLAVVAVGGWWIGGGGSAPSGSLEARLAAAETRVAELEESRDAAGNAAARVAELAREFDILRETLAGLDKKLAALPAQNPQAGAEAGAAMDGIREQANALVARLDGIEERLARLSGGAVGEAGAAALALGQETDATLAEIKRQLNAAFSRLASLELTGGGPGGDKSAVDGRDAALVLAVGQLREAVRAGGAFEAELTAARALAGPGAPWASPLDALAAHAKEGVPGEPALRRDFEAAARAAVLAAGGEAPRDWLERALAEAKSLVTVRRVGDIEGDEPDAVVARAELMLKQGDVAAAAAALDGLEGAPAAAVARWRARARAHLSVKGALAAVGALAVARLANMSE